MTNKERILKAVVLTYPGVELSAEWVGKHTARSLVADARAGLMGDRLLALLVLEIDAALVPGQSPSQQLAAAVGVVNRVLAHALGVKEFLGRKGVGKELGLQKE